MPGQKGAGKGGPPFPARRSVLPAVSGRLMLAFAVMSSFKYFEFGPPNKVREIFFRIAQNLGGFENVSFL